MSLGWIIIVILVVVGVIGWIVGIRIIQPIESFRALRPRKRSASHDQVVELAPRRRHRRRRQLDEKHSRWFDRYFPGMMLGSTFIPIILIGSLFIFHPSVEVGALTTMGTLLLALTPYGAMVFLAPGRHRLKILLVFTAAIAFIVLFWTLLSWLMPHGHF